MMRARESFHRTIGKAKVNAKKSHGSTSHGYTWRTQGILIGVRELDLSVQASRAEQRGILRAARE